MEYKNLNFKMEKDVWRRLRLAACQDDTTLQAWVLKAVLLRLDKIDARSYIVNIKDGAIVEDSANSPKA
jgi:hypothetical protein